MARRTHPRSCWQWIGTTFHVLYVAELSWSTTGVEGGESIGDYCHQESGLILEYWPIWAAVNVWLDFSVDPHSIVCYYALMARLSCVGQAYRFVLTSWPNCGIKVYEGVNDLIVCKAYSSYFHDVAQVLSEIRLHNP